jgi:hypothetical protein
LGGALLESVEQGVAEDSLEEVDRRGFLRGLGGAALGAAGLGAASQTQGKVRFDADGNRTSGFLGGGSTASTAPATSSAPATGSLKDQSAASRATAEKAAAAAAKIRYSNPKFNQEYERIEKTYEKIKSIVYNNKTPLSKDPDLARRQHAESIKILISADIEFAEKTNALLKQYGALKEQDVAEGFNSDLEMELHQLTKSPDMYDAIYNALGKNDAVGSHLQDMLYDIARENRLHPDDDQEQIIDIIADRLVKPNIKVVKCHWANLCVVM